MNQETKNALLESIAHWTRLADGGDEDIGPQDCALCGLFFSRAVGGCVKCPVFNKTKRVSCFETPYIKVAARQRDCHDSGVRPCDDETFRELAHDELEFLKSLLPVE